MQLTPSPVSLKIEGEARETVGDGEQGAKIRVIMLTISMLYRYHNWYTYNKNRDIRRQSERTICTYRNKHKNSRDKRHILREILHIQNLILTISTPRNIILNAGHTLEYVDNAIPTGCGSALSMKKPHRLTLVGFFFACTDPIITKCCVLRHSLRTSRTTQNNSFCIIGGGSLPTNEP